MEFNTSFLSGIAVGIPISYILFRILSRAPVEINKAVSVSKVAKKLKGEYKVVFVVRTDLGMGKGKIGSQCAHAAVDIYAQAQKSDPRALKWWETNGQTKIALKIDCEKDLRELAARARDAGLITSLIEDAGRTQIESGSLTVLGVGPAPKKLVDQVTGHLKLL